MFRKIFFIVFLLSFVLSACSVFGSSETPSSPPTASETALPTGTLKPTETEVPPTPIPPTATLAPSETPQPSVKWKLPDPPDANQLPTQLSVEIKYIDPPKDCAKENDANQTCSTIKGQETLSEFVLKSKQAIVMTGDGISIFKDNALLVDRPSLSSNHDLWVVTNSTGADLKLYMSAPFGSFRGYFQPVDGKWNIQKITHLRDLHLYLFLLPTQTYDRFTPTPVPNCESKYGCDMVNVRAIVFDDTGMNVAGYGLYKENQPFWQNLLQLLGQ